MILSDTYKRKLIDFLFRQYPLTIPEKVYVGLINASGEEISGGSYSRIEYDLSAISWFSTQGTVDEISMSGDPKTSNVANISWTALETWGNINKIRFFLESNGQDYFCDFDTEITVNPGDEVIILSGDFKIEL